MIAQGVISGSHADNAMWLIVNELAKAPSAAYTHARTADGGAWTFAIEAEAKKLGVLVPF
jgi:hypothetical protein